MLVGSIVLIIAGIAVLSGLADDMLGRVGLTKWEAVLWIVFVSIGRYFDVVAISEPQLQINFGGGVIPVVLAIFLLRRAETVGEKSTAAVASLLTGVGIFALTKLIPDNLGDTFASPLLLVATVAAIMGHIFSGGRRGIALIAAATGIILADILHFAEMVALNLGGQVWLGGGGAFDAIIIGAVLAVIIGEIVVEVNEKIKPRIEAKNTNPEDA